MDLDLIAKRIAEKTADTFHAQHNEDRKLLELLGHRSYGFYVDVGAWHPSDDSVTRHFYDRGWRGINIEPLYEYYRLLERDRPRDINLNFALDDRGGGKLRTFHRIAKPGAPIPESGLSTFDDENARSAVEREPFEVTDLSVLTFTLAEVCEQHVPPQTPIQFLKIDVEGWEEQVIRGADFERWRPKVLCIEATRPSSDVPAWDWEPLVLAADYEFLEFDSLNRWYRDAR